MSSIADLFTELKTKCEAVSPAVGLAVPQYDPLGRRSVSVNQNQGGSVYPFDGYCSLAGCVADITVTFAKTAIGNVYVTIDRDRGIEAFEGWELKTLHDYLAMGSLTSLATKTKVGNLPRLRFYDESGNILLDTADLTYHNMQTDGFWFFSDEPGRDTVRYAEYVTANDLDQPLLYPVSTEKAKLVSRCWATAAPVLRFKPKEGKYNDNITIIIEEGLVAEVEDNVIRISEVPDVDNRPVLKTINKVESDANYNFDILGDQACINIAPFRDDEDGYVLQETKFTAPLPHRLGIRNDCSECCNCSQYAHYFNEISNLILLHNYETEYLDYLTKYFTSLQDYYHQTINVRLKDLVKLKCMPGMQQSTVGFSISNPASQSLLNVKAKLNIVDNAIGGRMKRVMVYDAITEGDYPELTFTIPEIKAHSVWTGAVSACWDECGKIARVTFSAELPWCESTIECESQMTCEREVFPELDVMEKEEIDEILWPIPKPPIIPVF